MKGLLTRILQGAGLEEGGRIDYYNLSGEPARALWPHRLLAGCTGLLLVLFVSGMARSEAARQRRKPPSEKEITAMQAELGSLEAETEALKKSFDPEEAKALGVAVREANYLIALRGLKPTEIIDDLEAVKPFAGRLTGLQRKIDKNGAILLAFHLRSPGRRTYETFAARIARSHRFSNLTLKGEQYQLGEFEADIELEWARVGGPELTERPRETIAPQAPRLQPVSSRPPVQTFPVPKPSPNQPPQPAPSMTAPKPSPPKPAPTSQPPGPRPRPVPGGVPGRPDRLNPRPAPTPPVEARPQGEAQPAPAAEMEQS